MAGTATIPIIDISAEGADQIQVAKELVDAAVEYGFVYVRNAGRDISTEQIENAFGLVSSPDTQQDKLKSAMLNIRSLFLF